MQKEFEILEHLPYCTLCDDETVCIDLTFLIQVSCQPRVTVTSCFVYKVIRNLELIDHLCINPIHRIGLIHK